MREGTSVADSIGVATAASNEKAAYEALEPFARFMQAWNKRPLSGTADAFYAIHAGEEGAELRLSDCRRALAVWQEMDKRIRR